MRILVACEFSGIVREAFRARGHDAVSCDILPTEQDGPHLQCDVREVLGDGWDMMIAHPPCTYLTTTGNRWMSHPDDGHRPYEDRRPHPMHPDRRRLRAEAMEFFMALAEAPIPRIAIENPVGVMSRHWRRPDQTIQPYQFGHNASKRTCLWLKGLPELKSTRIVEVTSRKMPNGTTMSEWYYETSCLPHKDRAHARSITFQGIADAMAEQWG